jgi:hypothetical protein
MRAEAGVAEHHLAARAGDSQGLPIALWLAAGFPAGAHPLRVHDGGAGARRVCGSTLQGEFVLVASMISSAAH